jgi:hypothetical protein
VVNLKAILRNPFSFLFASSNTEDRMAAYVVREHGRGRSLEEILADPYVRNRCTDQQRARLLDNPEVVHAVGDDVVAQTRRALDGA